MKQQTFGGLTGFEKHRKVARAQRLSASVMITLITPTLHGVPAGCSTPFGICDDYASEPRRRRRSRQEVLNAFRHL